MTRPRIGTLCTLLALALGVGAQDAPLGIKGAATGEFVLLYGDALTERLTESGYMEAWLQLAQPEKPLRLRSLAWTGDEVGYRLRPEGYVEHLKNLLAKWPARTVVLQAGMSESFGGTAGLPEFKAQLGAYVKELQRRHPGAPIVLLSPIAVEDGAKFGPDAAIRNRDVEAYSKAMAELAAEQKLAFVDLFSASKTAYEKNAEPLTSNGILLNELGARVIGRAVAAGLAGDAALSKLDEKRVDEIAKAAAQKASWNADLARPKNAVVYYGVRKRPDEYAAEMPRYHQFVDMSEKIVHDMAHTAAMTFAEQPVPTLPPMREGKKKDAGKGTGVVKAPAEAMAEFKVADGYEVNLFASEEQFPELRNCLQIAFDARGRLWVVTMPSFPHTVPGQSREDKILILEDTDRDGKADKCTVFADKLDAMDGIAFHEKGVIVSEQPKLWVMQDTDNDGRSDTKRELLRGIDVTDSHHGGMIAADPIGHVWFCDGVFHRSQIETPWGVHRGIDATTYRFNPNTGRVETEWQSITPNPWKITFDRFGNAFQMYGDGLVLDGLPLTWTPLGVYHPFAYAKTIGYGKGSATASISSPNFPEAYQQGMASAALLGSYAVSLSKYDFSGGMARAVDRLDVLVSPNPAFRPVDLEFGFDGALYVSDFCSAIIGHAQHPMRDPQWDHTHGRIWRVINKTRPIVKDWPRIEGESAEALCALLTHPQDGVRNHARIQLRKLGAAALPALDKWIGAFDRTKPEFDQAALETLFVCEGLSQVRPKLLSELLKSKSAMHRAAATRMIRLQIDRLPDAAALFHDMATDPHPRVRMEVVDAVAHLRAAYPQQVAHAIHNLTAAEPNVKQMLAHLEYGTAPVKKRSVPVLVLAPESRLRHWMLQPEDVNAQQRAVDVQSKEAATAGSGLYRTWIEADGGQSAVLALKYSYVDISINGVQMLAADSSWSSDQQVQLELKSGINVLEIALRNLKGAPPAIYLFDTLGQPLAKARIASDAATLQTFAQDWNKAHADDALRVQAVPNHMQFSPRELRVKAGQKVRLIFENPDLMLHNLVLLMPGSEEEVGLLSEKMAAQPDAQAKNFVPESKKILYATPQVEPSGKAELNFDAPSKPGRYPYICTFPGHWRIMRGVMIVVGDKGVPEAPPATGSVRPIVKAWELKDFAADVAQAAGRSTTRGKKTFETAGCVQCHALQGTGGKVGPELTEVIKKFKGKDLLQQILEPSAVVEEKYRINLFTLADGRTVIGQVASEDETKVQVIANPLTPEVFTSVLKKDITKRKATPNSPMPMGLLDVLTKDEILDLLAYLEAGGKTR